LVSLDHFLFGGIQDRYSELRRLFQSRRDITDLKWDLVTKTKKIEQYLDRPMFAQSVKTQVPTAKLLFKGERKDWDLAQPDDCGRWIYESGLTVCLLVLKYAFGIGKLMP
jgi:hypothetical protein